MNLRWGVLGREEEREKGDFCCLFRIQGFAPRYKCVGGFRE